MKKQTSVVTCASVRITLACAMTWFSLLVIALAASAPPAAVLANAGTGDPARGKELFAKRCGGCHSLDSDKEGPRLRGVYGRRAGSVPSFKYSGAMKDARFKWDGVSLDHWLTNTESVVPDNDMDFRVPQPQERSDIIEFLRESASQ